MSTLFLFRIGIFESGRFVRESTVGPIEFKSPRHLAEAIVKFYAQTAGVSGYMALALDDAPEIDLPHYPSGYSSNTKVFILEARPVTQ